MARRRDKRSRRGEGSVHQDKQGQWWAQVSDGHGRKIRRRAASREAAETIQTEMNRKKAKSIDMRKGMQSLEEFATTWYTKVKEPQGLKPKTLDHYRQMTEYYILTRLGNYALEAIAPEDVQDFIAWMLQRGMSEQTIKHACGVLNQILTVAERWKYIERNPVGMIDIPKVRHHEPPAITMEQARQFLTSIEGHHLAPLYHLAIFLGLRRGELLGLRWVDVSWADNTIRIAQQVVATEADTRTITTPKSDRSARVLPLTPILAARLRAHWQKQTQRRITADIRQADALVFPGDHGKPIIPGSLSRQFKQLARAAGLGDDYHFHLLRHAAASFLAETDVNEAVIGAILGHSARTITRRYIQVSVATMRRAIEEVERRVWDVEAGREETGT